MHLQLGIIVLLLAASTPAEAVPTASRAISQDLLVGTWKCGPTSMKGPHLSMVVEIVTKRAADQTFVSTNTSVITPNGQPSVTVTDSARGTWRLEGTTLISTFKEMKFLSSSDPRISNEFGQKIHDDQLRKKAIYKSKILEISRETLRSIPIESDYVEAVVVSNCRRTEGG